MISTTQIFSQSPGYRKFNPYNKYPYSDDDYFYPNNKSNISSDFIRLDSLITNSIQGSGHKLIFHYNENAKISDWLTLFNFGEGWENVFNNKRYFDLNNNLICEIELAWSSNSNNWDSLHRQTYFYDEGNLFYSDRQFFQEGQWINLARYYYSFDENGNLIDMLFQNWSDNKWQYRNLVSYYYTNKLDSTLLQSWDGVMWQNYWKTIFYYKENEIDLDSLVAKKWTGSTWLNNVKREIVNDENHNQIEKIEKIWENDNWQNSIRYFTSYNKFDLMENEQCKLWQNNQWLDGDAAILFENSEDIRVAFITNNLSVYYSEMVSVHSELTSNPTGFSLSQNYPNPFNPSTTIQFTTGSRQFVTLKIFDVLGNEISTLVNEEKEPGTYSIEFSAKDGSASGGNAYELPSGIYFYRFEAGNYIATRKMILLR